jgi:hypothetical protein
MPVITQTELEEAKEDVDALEAFVNGDADPGTFTTRLGTPLKTIALLQAEVQGELSYAVLDDAPALRLYTRPAGTTAVILRGWATEFDANGGQILVYDAASGAVDDGVDVIVGADAARWRRLPRGPEIFEVPIPYVSRFSETGTWTMSSGYVLEYTGAAGSNAFRVLIPTLPVNSVITQLRMRMQQADATSLLDLELQSKTTVTVSSGANALDSNVDSDSSTAEKNVITTHSRLVDSTVRYFARVGAAGAGTGLRKLAGLWVTYTTKPPAV